MYFSKGLDGPGSVISQSHALGTLTGALLAAKMAASHKMLFAYVIGCLFLAGGIANIIMLPSPVWFAIVDLEDACIPMAYLVGKWVYIEIIRTDQWQPEEFGRCHSAFPADHF